jgi:hypothetical protein
MHKHLALLVFALTAGCHSLDARDPLPPSRALRTPATLSLKLDRAYEPGLHSGRFSPAIDMDAVSTRALDLLVERKTAVPGSGLTLEATVVQGSIKYDGQTGVFPLKVFFTIFFFPIDFPNYFISSDKFALTLVARWRLLDQGQVVAEGTAEGRQSGTFGDFSRGWYFVGYLRMPNPLNADEWGEIATELRPGAQEALAGALAVECEQALAARKP